MNHFFNYIQPFKQPHIGQKQPDTINFRSGQIFNGRILFINAQNQALVQIGKEKIVAKIDAPIDTEKNYWFEVVKSDGKVLLKVLPNITNTESLLNLLELPNNASMKQFLSAWKENQLPIDKDLVHLAVKWLKQAEDTNLAISTIRLMLIRSLPMTDEIFNSLSTEVEAPSKLYNNLLSQLMSSSISSGNTLTMLKHLLGTDGQLSSTVNTLGVKGESIFRNLISIIRMIGFNYENKSMKGIKENLPLKGELLALLQNDIPPQIKNNIEQVLRHITNTQLQFDDRGDFLQIALSLPIPLPNQTLDTKLTFRGKKDKNQQLDPNFCHIILDFEMDAIGPIITSIRVQNRIISLQIHSDFPNIDVIANPLVGLLKENIEQSSYILSSIKFEKINKEKLKSNTMLNEHRSLSASELGNLDVRI